MRHVIELGSLRGPRGKPLIAKRHTARQDTLFGSRYTDLGHYLSSKYGIYRNDVTAICEDIFKYIEMEVLAGSGRFTVPRFGRFERREMQAGNERVTVMRFTRSAVRRGGTYIDWDDPEWVSEEQDDE